MCLRSCKTIAGAAKRAHSARQTLSYARRRGRHRPRWPRSARESASQKGRALLCCSVLVVLLCRARAATAAATASAAASLGAAPSSESVRTKVLGCIANLDDGTDESGCPAGRLSERYEQFHIESEVVVPGVARALASGVTLQSSFKERAPFLSRSQPCTLQVLKGILTLRKCCFRTGQM